MKPIIHGTGWLQKDAWTATQPTTYKRIVCFDLMLTNSRGEPVKWSAEIHDEALATKVEPKLVAGAAVIFRAILDAMPYVRHDVQKGFTRYLIVTDLEFSRLPGSAEAEPAEVATTA